ncbi:MAG TPA: porin [Desulfuromonadaceae bacterium]|nr:porin [Desulfuromonadaceae bacterium]
MNWNRLLIGTVLGSTFAFQALAQGSSAASPDLDALKKDIQALQQRIDTLEQQSTQSQSAQIGELDQKVRVLERKREIDQEAAVAAVKTTPRFTLGSGGFSATSADSNFVFTLKGLIQVDNRSFLYEHQVKGNDTFLLRRARPIFQGTVYRDFDFVLVPDFAGSAPSIFDAYVNYRYQPWLQLRAGKFKVPVGLEQLQSDPVIAFNERSLVTDLTPNRDIGFQLWGDVDASAAGVWSYAVGVFNGLGDGRSTSNSDYENHREIAARLFVQPFKNLNNDFLQGLGFGVGSSWGNISSNALGLTSGYTTDGQQTFFAYTNGVVADRYHWRLSPQAYYYYGPLSLLGEYVISEQDVQKGATRADLRNRAWEVTAGWVLTGESASYTGITPKHPFDPHNGGWGAVQIVGRYADLDIDDRAFPAFANPNSSASAAHAWSAGVNWFLNKNIRVNASYSHTIFDGGNGSGATVTKQPEDVFFTRIQLAF